MRDGSQGFVDQFPQLEKFKDEPQGPRRIPIQNLSLIHSSLPGTIMSDAESLAPLELLEPTVVDASVANCPLCFAQVGITDPTCGYCGAIFEEELAMCAECLARVPIAARRCETCGSVL